MWILSRGQPKYLHWSDNVRRVGGPLAFPLSTHREVWHTFGISGFYYKSVPTILCGHRLVGNIIADTHVVPYRQQKSKFTPIHAGVLPKLCSYIRQSHYTAVWCRVLPEWRRQCIVDIGRVGGVSTHRAYFESGSDQRALARLWWRMSGQISTEPPTRPFVYFCLCV